MASSTVVAAVEARIGATWTGADGVVIVVRGLNADSDPPADGSPHIELQFPVGREHQLTIGAPGANQWKEEGGFRVVLNERRGVGPARARAWIEELRTLYRGQLLSGTVQCYAPSPPVEDDHNDLGNYWQLAFVVEYRTFVTG